MEFYRVSKLPPYIFSIVDEMKYRARREGKDVIDFGMGNPDGATPEPVVRKLIEAVNNPKNHRYSISRGIFGLRKEIQLYYQRRFGVELDPEKECIVTIGSKEGLAHLLLAIITPGDVVLVPDPSYPIHTHGVVIAGGHLAKVKMGNTVEKFFNNLVQIYSNTWPRPRFLLLNFPHNPTTQIVELDFFEAVIDFARKYDLFVIHDHAYADLCFDDYKSPSILQVKGAKEIAVECYSLSKSYNMPGWRVGFVVGNEKVIHALSRVKSYLDYGIFQPIQIAAIVAMRMGEKLIEPIREKYRERRDLLVQGLNDIGWHVEKPRATMFVWAKIPEKIDKDSLSFAKYLLSRYNVAVSPGIGFGDAGEGYVRFALVENRQRTRQALRQLKKLFRDS